MCGERANIYRWISIMVYNNVVAHRGTHTGRVRVIKANKSSLINRNSNLYAS